MRLNLLKFFKKKEKIKEKIKEKKFYCEFCNKEAVFFIRIQDERKKFCQKHYNNLTSETINNKDEVLLENMYIQKIEVGGASE